MKFSKILENMPFIITEGAILERLRRNPLVHPDPHILNAGLIYDNDGKASLRKLYREYLEIGQSYNLPIMIHTPTWRANRDRIKKAGYRESDDINGDCFRFVSEIRNEYGNYSKQIFIGGLIGCKGDAYKPAESLSTREAVSFHGWQLKNLFAAGVDFFTAETLPAADEALGIAIAMAKYDIPYILSFILKPTGTLLDGSPLHEVISMIDKDVKPVPYFYMANCIHPSIFEAAMAIETAKSMTITGRVIGLQANTSIKSPAELEGLPYLDTEDPEIFARSMTALYKRFGTRILGGCCGTDNRHIECIARQIRGI